MNGKLFVEAVGYLDREMIDAHFEKKERFRRNRFIRTRMRAVLSALIAVCIPLVAVSAFFSSTLFSAIRDSIKNPAVKTVGNAFVQNTEQALRGKTPDPVFVFAAVLISAAAFAAFGALVYSACKRLVVRKSGEETVL